MSGSLGFDVVTTAQHLDMALVDVESILTDFVTQINLSLGMANPNIRNKVNLILKRAIRDVEAIIDPILKVSMSQIASSAYQHIYFNQSTLQLSDMTHIFLKC